LTAAATLDGKSCGQRGQNPGFSARRLTAHGKIEAGLAVPAHISCLM
jgi:hypothetical protein